MLKTLILLLIKWVWAIVGGDERQGKGDDGYVECEFETERQDSDNECAEDAAALAADAIGACRNEF